MSDKIILKPTDYVALENGGLEYSYSYEEQYLDAEKLNELSKSELLDEMNRRWKEVQMFPIPSKVSRYALARDMAFAKGYDTGKADKIFSEHTSCGDESQREM